MNSALFANTNSVVPYTDAMLDLSGSTGLLVVPGGNGFVLNTSATVPATGIILDGAPPGIQSAIGLLAGALPPVRTVAAGAITQFALVCQDAGGGVKANPGTGTGRCVCGVALDAATAAGQYIRVAFDLPQIAS